MKFKVYEQEIPSKITLNLGLTERALFARMLTAYGISVEDAGDTFEHLLKTGLRELYEKRFSNDKRDI